MLTKKGGKWNSKDNEPVHVFPNVQLLTQESLHDQVYEELLEYLAGSVGRTDDSWS